MLGPGGNADEFTIYYGLFVYVQLLFRLMAAMPLSVSCRSPCAGAAQRCPWLCFMPLKLRNNSEVREALRGNRITTSGSTDI